MAGTAAQLAYRNEMVLGFGQRQSLLRDTVTTEAMIKGVSATFMVVDSSGTAVTRGVNGLIPAGDNSNTQVVATLVEKHDLRRMSGFNIFQSQGNQKDILQMNTMSVLNRDIDSVILTELLTGTITTGSATAASMTLIQKAMVYLQTNGVPWDGNVFAVISPAFLAYMMSITQFASADFVTVKPATNFPGWNSMDPKAAANMGAGWYEWMGVKWIVSNQISGIGGAAEKCFMYHRNAIGHAIDTAGMDTAIGYDEEQQYSFARTSLFHGPKLLQNTGVVEMTHDGSAIIAS